MAPTATAKPDNCADTWTRASTHTRPLATTCSSMSRRAAVTVRTSGPREVTTATMPARTARTATIQNSGRRKMVVILALVPLQLPCQGPAFLDLGTMWPRATRRRTRRGSTSRPVRSVAAQRSCPSNGASASAWGDADVQARIVLGILAWQLTSREQTTEPEFHVIYHPLSQAATFRQAAATAPIPRVAIDEGSAVASQ